MGPRLRHLLSEVTEPSEALFRGTSDYPSVLESTSCHSMGQRGNGLSSCRGSAPAGKAPECDSQDRGHEEKRRAGPEDGAVSAGGR